MTTKQAHSDRWKKHELKTARAFGCERSGPLGKKAPDFDHPFLAPECKSHNGAPPKWYQEAIDQAVRNCPPGKLPLVIRHWKGKPRRLDTVEMRRQDFEDWFGRLSIAEPEEEVHDQGQV